jgi:hypothetical protein
VAVAENAGTGKVAAVVSTLLMYAEGLDLGAHEVAR